MHDIKKIMRQCVKSHKIVNHPFYQELKNRSFDEQAIRIWAEQQYFMSISLAPAFAALIARAPFDKWKERVIITELTAEETWGYGGENHGELFCDFYQSVGGSPENFIELTPLPTTINAAQGRIDISLGKNGEYSLTDSALALAWANEYVNLFIFGRLRQATKTQDFDKSYFEAHIEDEKDHFEDLLCFANLLEEESNIEKNMVAVKELLDLRSAFFDGILDIL